MPSAQPVSYSRGSVLRNACPETRSLGVPGSFRLTSFKFLSGLRSSLRLLLLLPLFLGHPGLRSSRRRFLAVMTSRRSSLEVDRGVAPQGLFDAGVLSLPAPLGVFGSPSEGKRIPAQHL
ncbi:hypothetical protein HYQ46_011202 [Verticillium longisporum]|nr:hypothetical protein HYQ46_011202 [Verticillium longisporum]